MAVGIAQMQSLDAPSKTDNFAAKSQLGSHVFKFSIKEAKL